jgi:hypothetical protein
VTVSIATGTSLLPVGDWVPAMHYLGSELIDAPHVDTGHWQALKDVPQTQTRELRAVTLTYEIPRHRTELQAEVQPNLPWAENQFQERVGGEPLNPGETYLDWPWYKGNVSTHQDRMEKFSHTYMERYWPRFTGAYAAEPPDGGPGYGGVFLQGGEPRGQKGIRYRYGDLNDVVKLLAREPYTRQAYLPVWFPEDTGAHANQRVPCSLGYHFMLREKKLHCLYTIRSCDFLRHFRDDVYMTARLVQWMIEKAQLHHLKYEWDDVVPGDLTMVMHSLHVFEGDMPKMRKEYGNG